MPNHLGDAVMALDALGVALAAWKGTVTLLVRRELVCLFERVTGEFEILPHAWPLRWRWAGHLENARRIRAKRCDTAVLLLRGFEFALWTAMAGVGDRRGRGWWQTAALLSRSFREPVEIAGAHESERFRWLVAAALDVDPATSFERPRVVVPAADFERQREWLSHHRRYPERPLVVLLPVANHRLRGWPLESYCATARRLIAAGWECLVVVAPWEKHQGEQFARLCAEVLVKSDADLSALVALLGNAQGCVGNNGGGVHLAAELGVPTVSVEFASDPRRHGPRGPRVRWVGRPWQATRWRPFAPARLARRRALEIVPEEIVAALEELRLV